MQRKFLSFFLFYLPALFVQMVSSKVTMGSLPWYQTLPKSALTPPDYLFGPVWTLLYIMMSIAIWLIFHTPSKHKKLAVTLFFVQLFFNGLWSILFFHLHSPFFALIDLSLLLLLNLWLLFIAYKVRKSAMILLTFYCLWLFYAWVLNWQIYRMIGL